MPTPAQAKANATRITNQQTGIPTVRQQRAMAAAAKASGQPIPWAPGWQAAPPAGHTAPPSTGRPTTAPPPRPQAAPPPPPRPQAPPVGRRRRGGRRPFNGGARPFTPPPPPPPFTSGRPAAAPSAPAPLPSWVNAGPKPTATQLKLTALVALEAAVKGSMNLATLTPDQRKGWETYQKCKSLALGTSVGPEAASALRMATIAIVKLVF